MKYNESKLKFYKNVSVSEARNILKELCGDRNIYEKYFPNDNLLLFFLEEPDEYYQNYFAQRGESALVVDINELSK